MIKIYSQAVGWRGPQWREVTIWNEHLNGEQAAASPLTFKVVDPGDMIGNPTIGAPYGHEFLQAALDHAWEVGLRPAGFSDTPLQVQAIKAHLADMRALVFMSRLPAFVPPDIAAFQMQDVPGGLKGGS